MKDLLDIDKLLNDKSIDSNDCCLGVNIKSTEYHKCTVVKNILGIRRSKKLIEFLNGTDK